MPIFNFVLNAAHQITPLPLFLFICDLVLTTFVQIAFGTTHGFFRYRNQFDSGINSYSRTRGRKRDTEIRLGDMK